MTTANRNDVEQFALGLQRQKLQCRTYGHSFAPHSVNVGVTVGRANAYYEQTLRCRCGVKRRLLLSRSGSVISSSYIYNESEGYLSSGLGRIVGEGKDALRMEMLTRLIGEAR
jgi:hypothetical protein